MRYLVLDTHWIDDCGAMPWNRRGHVLGTFNSYDDAKGLALQWMSLGDIGVVVIDLVKGHRVFPRD